MIERHPGGRSPVIRYGTVVGSVGVDWGLGIRWELWLGWGVIVVILGS